MRAVRAVCWGALFVGAVAVVAACGSASVEGDPITPGTKLPSRSNDDNNNDASTSDDAGTPSQTGSPSTPDGGGSSGTTTDAKAPSQTCALANLALCFTFEGVTTDLSAAPITPSDVENVAFVQGKEGLAASFSQASILHFAPNAAFELPAGAATIEAWVKRQNAAADAVVFDDDGRFSLTINAAGNVWCKSSGGAVTGANVVAVDQWAHVACVIDNGVLHAYLNGVEDIAPGPGSVGSAPTLAAAIGGNSPDGEPFIGLIDSFRVFRVARSAALIAADAAQ